ncbi:hypothetical protein L486_01471 [Kwoniella mangroviensis CBS 10435]|uniref:Uncharacterized protein n=1 Tax=Kwoniella mangroviensis CBS 10435 TaxID=1331196 RepID=A0A1B9J242_9TREE|nr:hypothetical protein L486_01471 [Kwoniella mangroviensis CBS 10435]
MVALGDTPPPLHLYPHDASSFADTIDPVESARPSFESSTGTAGNNLEKVLYRISLSETADPEYRKSLKRLADHFRGLPTLRNRFSVIINSFVLESKYEEAKAKGYNSANRSEAILDDRTKFDISPWLGNIPGKFNFVDNPQENSKVNMISAIMVPRSFSLRSMVEDQSEIVKLIKSDSLAQMQSIELQIDPGSNSWVGKSISTESFKTQVARDQKGELNRNMVVMTQSDDDPNRFTAQGDQVNNADSQIRVCIGSTKANSPTAKAQFDTAIGTEVKTVDTDVALRIDLTRELR